MKYDLKKMLDMAKEARDKAYAPYSQFQVGSCIFTADGLYYAGCNVENTSYPMAQCAEASAVGNMILGGSQNILTTVVMTDTVDGVFPCGGCLQKMSEFMEPDAEIIAANLAGKVNKKKLSELFCTQFRDLFSELKRV